jgi:hypothetical protein
VLLLSGMTYLRENHFQQWQQLNQNTVTTLNFRVTYKLLYCLFIQG